MSLGGFSNETRSVCTAPLLDETLFPKKGGYQAGRYCGLGSFEVGASQASCCFPCPIQDWIYPPDWKTSLRIPNYLSLLNVLLCSFLLLSFLLSLGLLVPVLLISLSFAIPVSTNPPYCFDAITPSDMHDSQSCAWTGSLVTLGGLGCVIWVCLRSLWLFVRIVFDVAPGKRFMWGTIVAGTLVPVGVLVAVLASTGFSYRMGQTCLPNEDRAIVTFWVWLVTFAVAGFLLQGGTTAYCVWIYVHTLQRERSNPSAGGRGYGGRGGTWARRTNLQTWANVKKLFLLQWRNILVSIFVLVGSLVFFVVFWTQDRKLGRVFNDDENLRPCRKYVEGFTVSEPSVLVALILASLVGIEIFILLFRRSMARAWLDLFKHYYYYYTVRLRKIGARRAQTPELTSFDNPEKYSLPSPNHDSPRAGEGTETSPSSNPVRHSVLKSPPPSSPPPTPYRLASTSQPLLPHTSSASSAPPPTHPPSHPPLSPRGEPPSHPSTQQLPQRHQQAGPSGFGATVP
ncbi:hypothetical protein BDW02DRAFT_591196 [Decorospora gaudefroyi]|uniref:G-protein coupled receptors family 2 profile 2 domain-containing protein n=1 Tax=Decorospora gaudefroyi TaxID=184978 RepID=A0A6A5K3G9_9PLEO|nr:hypothetical protein BDW02DRAFT_591196 [Decorospora gaudefroyi]